MTLEKNSRGGVIWITGLPNSGKTTLANKLYSEIQPLNPRTFKLDGDELRDLLKRREYDYEGRKELSMIYSHISCSLASMGYTIIISTVSLFHQIHAWNRSHIKNYIEIYLKSDLPFLLKRDNRKIYENKNHVVGLHIAPEYPLNPDIVLDSEDEESLNIGFVEILKKWKIFQYEN